MATALFVLVSLSWKNRTGEAVFVKAMKNLWNRLHRPTQQSAQCDDCHAKDCEQQERLHDLATRVHNLVWEVYKTENPDAFDKLKKQGGA